MKAIQTFNLDAVEKSRAHINPRPPLNCRKWQAVENPYTVESFAIEFYLNHFSRNRLKNNLLEGW